MKTSDKLLLGIFIVLLVIFTGVQVTLYAKYKSGNILSGKEMVDKQFSAYHPEIAKNLFISGFHWVTIIPSDSFYFQVARDGQRIPGLPYNRLADTLKITGDDLMKRNSIGYLNSETGFWQLIVYCPLVTNIQLKTVDAAIVGNFQPGGNDFHFTLYDAHLSVASFNYPDTIARPQYFTHLWVNADTSTVYLNKNAHIDSLILTMDKKSIVNDYDASLNGIEINCPEKTNINLTAQNIKKLKLKPGN